MLRCFLDNRKGGSAVEFALIVPVFLFFLLGIIDVGRFMWNINEAEKATQIGTRWAAATDYIAPEIFSYSYAINGGVPQGTTVPESKFGGVVCTSDGSTATCTCTGTCTFSGPTADQDAFNRLVGRMNEIYGGIGSANVVVVYSYSGLGYAGDPIGSDVDPIVTVEVKDLQFNPIFLAGIFGWGLPTLSYSLTMEDGEGYYSN